MDIVLYVLSWFRIRKETEQLKTSLGKSSQSLRASHRAAKTMSLFVIAFFVQWWAMSLYGIWQLVADVPQLLFNFVTTFSNVGGILNGFVFIIIMRRKREHAENTTHDDHHTGSSGHTLEEIHSHDHEHINGTHITHKEPI